MKRPALLVLTAILLAASAGAAAASDPAAHVAYAPGKASASGDVNGDGRTDGIRFKGQQFATGKLTVKLAKGKTLSRRTGLITTSDAGIVKVANLDGRKGDEIVVRTQHISTCDTYLVYADRKGALTKIDGYCSKNPRS